MVKLIALICALNLKSYNTNMDLSLKFHAGKGIYFKTSLKNITNIDSKSVALTASYGLKNVIFKFIGIEYCKSSSIFYAVISVNFLFFLHINFKIGYSITNKSCVASIEAETNARMINCAVNMNKTVANSKELKELTKTLHNARMQQEHMSEKTKQTLSQTTKNILTCSISNEIFTSHKEYTHTMEGLVKAYMQNDSDKCGIKKLIIELSLRFQYMSDIQRMKMESHVLKQSNECALRGFETYYQELKLENEELINKYNDFSDAKKNSDFFLQINSNQQKIMFMDYVIKCKQSGASVFTFEKLDQYNNIFNNNPDYKEEREICLKEKERMTEQLRRQCSLNQINDQILKKQTAEIEELKSSLVQHRSQYEALKKEISISEAELENRAKQERALNNEICLNKATIDKHNSEIAKLRSAIKKNDSNNANSIAKLLSEIKETNDKSFVLQAELEKARKSITQYERVYNESKKNEEALQKVIIELEANEKERNNYIKNNAELLQKLSASNDQLRTIEAEKASIENNHKIETKRMIEEHCRRIEESSKAAADNKEKEIKKLQQNHEQALINLDSSCNNLINKIKKEKEMLSKILSESKDQNEAYQAAAKKIEDEHKKEKEQIAEEYNKKIKQLSKATSDDKENHKKELDEIKQKLKDESNIREQINKEYETALKESDASYSNSIKELKQRIKELTSANHDKENKHEIELQNIKINNEKEKERIEKQHKKDMQKLSEENDISFQKQIKELKEKHEMDLKKSNLMHDDLKKQLTTMTEELKQLKIKNQKESEKNLKNELEANILRQKFEAATATLKAGERKIEELKKANLSLSGASLSLSNQLLSASDSNKTLQDELSKNEKKIQSLAKELEKADLKSASNINESLKELKKSQEELQKQIKSNSDLKNTNKELESKSKEEKEALIKQLNALTASVSSSFYLIRTDSNAQSLSKEINGYLNVVQSSESSVEERLKNFIKLNELCAKKIEKRVKEQEEINKSNAKALEQLEGKYKIAITKFDNMKKAHEEYIKSTNAKNKELIEQHEAEIFRVKEEAEKEFKRKMKEENEKNIKILQASSNENMDLKLKLIELNKIINDLKSSGDIQSETIKNLQNQLTNKSTNQETCSYTHSRKWSNKNSNSSSVSKQTNQDSDHLINSDKKAVAHSATNGFRVDKSTRNNTRFDQSINAGKFFQEAESAANSSSECSDSESSDLGHNDAINNSINQNISKKTSSASRPNNRSFYPSASDIASLQETNASAKSTRKVHFKQFDSKRNNMQFHANINDFTESEIAF